MQLQCGKAFGKIARKQLMPFVIECVMYLCALICVLTQQGGLRVSKSLVKVNRHRFKMRKFATGIRCKSEAESKV